MAVVDAIWRLLCQMSPYLLLGFSFAALLYAFVPPVLLNRLTGRGLKSVFVASFIGAPLPLCSCSVLPTALAFRRRGASDGATASFLIATPITSVDSVVVTYAFFGWMFALYRLLSSLVVAVSVGLVSHILSSSDSVSEHKSDSCQYCGEVKEHSHGLGERMVKGVSYGFQMLPAEIGRWILLGIVVGGILTVVLPKEELVRYAGRGLLPLVVMLGVGVPLYVCSTGSVPIAAALVGGGFSVGSAIVFLLVGPATNLSAILALWRVLGRRFIVVYLLMLIATSLFVGYIYDTVFVETASVTTVQKMHSESPSLLSGLLALVLLGLLLFTHIKSSLSGKKKEEDTISTQRQKTELAVSDLKCTSCSSAVSAALRAIDGVEEVVVDLKARKVTVYHSGSVTRDSLVEAVKGAGYSVDENVS